MSKPANELPEQKDAEREDNAGSQLNSPEIDKDGKITKRAVDGFKQAHGICAALWQRAKQFRLNVAALILGKYNGESPFPQDDLDKTAQNWRNNFSTNFLGSIIDRIKPQLLDPFLNSDTLTHSALPADYEGAAEKSRIFQTATTACIRKWNAWVNFCNMLAQEVIMFGYASPAWLDDDWRPILFRVDEACLPEGTGQHSSKVQVFVARQAIALHDFMDLISNREAAKIAKYDLDGCYSAINAAGTSQTNDPSPVTAEDAKREGVNSSYLFENQTRNLNLYHMLVREYEGGVDLWTTEQKAGHGIRHVKGIHERMEDALVLFTLQTGNGKFYGSKGMGRMLCNLHIAIERLRCLASDQMYLSGLTIIQGDAGKFNSFIPTVRHPFVMVDENFKIAESGIVFKAQDFQIMESHLVQLAESIAGAFVPPNIETGNAPNTKIEAAAKAEREIAVREGVLARFMEHGFEMTGTMQRKIYSKENLKEALRVYRDKSDKKAKGLRVIQIKAWKLISSIVDSIKDRLAPQLESKIADNQAVETIVSLLESGLKIEEIAALALEPAAPQTKNLGSQQDTATAQFITGMAASPFMRQDEAFKMLGEIAIGEDRLKRLFNDRQDPTLLAVAQRDQKMELAIMMGGEALPVAGTDEHVIHRSVLRGEFAPMIPGLLQSLDPKMIKAVELASGHYLDHLSQDKITPDADKKQEGDMVKEWVQATEKAKLVLAQKMGAEQANAEQKQNEQAAVQQPPPMDPKDQADLALREHDQQLRARDQDLKEQQHALDVAKAAHEAALETAKHQHTAGLATVDQEHNQAMDRIAATTEQAQAVADQAKVAVKEGEAAGADSMRQNA